MNIVEQKRWIISNGITKGDEKGEFTLTDARRNYMIDYKIVNEKCWKVPRGSKLKREWNHMAICLETNKGDIPLFTNTTRIHKGCNHRLN